METYDKLQLFLNYPLISANRNENKRLHGYLQVNDIDYEINLWCDSDNHLKLERNTRLKHFEEQIQAIEENCSDMLVFLDKLKGVLSVEKKSYNAVNYGSLAAVYWSVINEYLEFRQFYFNVEKCSLATDLSQVEVFVTDEGKRSHKLIIGIDFDDGLFYVKQKDLPVVDNENEVKKASLRIIYEEFVSKLEKLQEFFDAVDEIDCVCWVLDPELPKRADLHRRIALREKNSSVLLTFNLQLLERSLPDLKLLGPESSIAKYKETLAENLPSWTPSGSVLQDVLFLLGVESFPAKSQTEKTPTSALRLYEDGDCCICYLKRLNGKLTEIICSNKRCESFFHVECLYEWLISMNARKSFNEINGQCPACEKFISCPIPSDV